MQMTFWIVILHAETRPDAMDEYFATTLVSVPSFDFKLE